VGSRQSSRRGLVDNGAVVSARELAGVEAARAARFLRSADERGKEEEGMGGCGLDDSGDTLQGARQLAKAPGRARRMEDTRW
jgi:hypothetical protein